MTRNRTARPTVAELAARDADRRRGEGVGAGIMIAGVVVLGAAASVLPNGLLQLADGALGLGAVLTIVGVVLLIAAVAIFVTGWRHWQTAHRNGSMPGESAGRPDERFGERKASPSVGGHGGNLGTPYGPYGG